VGKNKRRAFVRIGELRSGQGELGWISVVAISRATAKQMKFLKADALRRNMKAKIAKGGAQPFIGRKESKEGVRRRTSGGELSC